MTARRYRKDAVIMTPLVCKIIWFAGIVCWVIIRYPFHRKAKRNSVVLSRYGRRKRGILGFAGLCLYVIPGVYALTGFPESLDRLFIPAIGWLEQSYFAGIMAVFSEPCRLGKNWSISLEVRERHALVQTGIYRFIRHPMYASFFVLALAQFLLLPNWGAGVAGLVGVSVLYAFRVRNEERLMHETFGSDYVDYMTKTKRLIPWIF